MMSARGCFILGSVPLLIIANILHTILFGGRFRKYRRSIKANLTLLFGDIFLSLPVLDCQYLAMSAYFQIKHILPLIHHRVVKCLPGYGERFDENSIWLVKHQDIHHTNTVLIYLHGGGYFIEVSFPQIESVLACYKLTSSAVQDKLSVLHLDYSLTCNGFLMPSQLYQLHNTYSKLLKLGYKDIILMGDSAGGNLAITYCQYLQQNNLNVFPKHLILLSPWTKLYPEPYQYEPGQSYYDNDNKDILNYKTAVNPERMKNIVGDLENLNSLTISPGNKSPIDQQDWAQIPTFNRPGYGVLVVTGEDEVLRDDILEWCYYALGVPLINQYTYGNSNNKMAQSYEYVSEDPNGAKIHIFVEPWGVHDSMFVLEGHLLKEIKHNSSLNAYNVDQEKYFGTTRVAQFLNEVLLE